MNRTQIINYLAVKFNYKSYLEIGIGNGKNFSNVSIENKVSVDPNAERSATFIMTSDHYFSISTDTFDIIFIDGLHHSPQVYRDIINSLSKLNDNGTIVCHDMIPLCEVMQKIPREVNCWTGDCWRSFVKLRSEERKLSMCVVDTDFGVGLIRRGEQELISASNLSYADFDENKSYLLNIISVEDFIKFYPHLPNSSSVETSFKKI